MRLGIFGGSFDPVHLEHQRLCRAAIKSLRLDKLFVVPAAVPPHKKGKTLSPDGDRLAACRLAFEDDEKIEVSDFEILSQGTSYTYLTIRAFKEKYPDAKLFFLVGTDMLRDFPTWKNPEEILSNATLAVCARAENSSWYQQEREAFYKRFRTDFAVIGYEGKSVSSTRVRVLAAAGEDISPLVGERVAKYIDDKGVYEMTGVRRALSLQKQSRKEHTLRVAFFAAENAARCKVDEKKAVFSALLHDCAKNLADDSPLLDGFTPPVGVPKEVVHQYAGAFVAQTALGVTDEEVLAAVRYHTSGSVGAGALEKLVFLADMLEEGRNYPEVEEIRNCFFTQGLDACYLFALEKTLAFLERKGGEIYPLTRRAYEYEKKESESHERSGK